MTVHLVKLCVGVDSVAELVRYREELQRKRRAAKKPLEDQHWTRSFPKRAEEVLDGGSLYWVIRGRIAARHRILRLDEVEDEQGKPYCAIVYDPTVIVTESHPRRAFQGWRYLEVDDAPADLADQRTALRQAMAEEDLPEDLRDELRTLGLL
ncbi:DUF1489 family protein [Dongia rigui]|uniref:DUF1489 domain-containing protein n=1 Tax=Dongia rigui TaxID=940149 RepID=A0ABU5E1M7_9PROT|nr:DUF1489 domain-containing protein [Dongia rigui]MDY0873388.1 DUF1489 domain-containing protein [Dongia rigui]